MKLYERGEGEGFGGLYKFKFKLIPAQIVHIHSNFVMHTPTAITRHPPLVKYFYAFVDPQYCVSCGNGREQQRVEYYGSVMVSKKKINT